MAKKPKVTPEATEEIDPPEAEPSVAPRAIDETRVASYTVTFVGDPRGGTDPAEAEYGGKTFPKGKAVKVEADWLKANPNITGNNHFKVE